MDIEIVELDDNIEKGSNNGDKFFVKLNGRPEEAWSKIFMEKWKRPSTFSSMHAPSIASISGNKVILDNTDISIVKSTHLATLKLVVGETNQAFKNYQSDLQQKAKEKAEKDRQEKERIQSVKDQIKDINKNLD